MTFTTWFADGRGPQLVCGHGSTRRTDYCLVELPDKGGVVYRALLAMVRLSGRRTV